MKKVNSELIWAVIQLFSKQGVNLIILLLISYFVTPAEFGIYSIAFSFFQFFSLVADTGFNAAIIQKKNIAKEQIDAIYSLNIVLSLALVLICLFSINLISHFYKQEGLGLVVSALSMNLFFIALSSTHSALLQKQLNFKALTVRDITSVLFGGVSAAIAVYFGLGLWALVIQSLASYIVSAICMHFLSEQKMTFTINKSSFNLLFEILLFSKNIFGFNIVKYLSQNLDIFYIGYILGAKSAGLFAYFDKLIIIPFTMLSGAIGNYIFAKYANMNQESGELSNAFSSIQRKHNLVIIPLIVLYCAAITVLLKLDVMPKWKEAADFIPLMGILVIVQVVISPMNNILKAINRSNYLFY